MNCNSYENLMMRHFEKTISPQDAHKLMKHVLLCEHCRELYLTLDEATESVLKAPPANFTDKVMTTVRECARRTAETVDTSPSESILPKPDSISVHKKECARRTAETVDTSPNEHILPKPACASLRANRRSIIPRILVAVNILLFGAGFTFMLNPDFLHALPYPAVHRLLHTFTSIGAFASTAIEHLAQTAPAFSIYGATALILATVTGTLLFVLHSGGKVET